MKNIINISNSLISLINGIGTCTFNTRRGSFCDSGFVNS